jgi:multidrug efflux system membrane fusion protein
VEAYDRDLKNRLAKGELEAIDNQVDPGTGTVRLKARFSNDDSALFPNQFVNARLLVDTLKGAVIVPTAALQQSPQGAFVYVVKADSTVDMRIVEIQATEGDNTALRSGLKAGEMVVTDGLEKLRPGSKVSIARPDAPGNTKAKS